MKNIYRFSPILTILFFSNIVMGMDPDTKAKKIIVPTPLHQAAKEGNIITIKTILDNKEIDINSIDCRFSNTALHSAAWFNKTEAISILLKHKANFSIVNEMGSTPLHSAAWKNNSGPLQKLLEAGACAIGRNATGTGNTPLYLAAKAGSTDCLTILLDHLRKTLNDKDFIKHINEECAGDKSTAIQAAGLRKQPQCYWNLVIAGANPCQEMDKNRYRGRLVSEWIKDNIPFQKFVSAIEKDKNNPPIYDHAMGTTCFLCYQDYAHNDVIMLLLVCNHSFHADCFRDYVMESFARKHSDIDFIKKFNENNPDEDIVHELRSNPHIRPMWNHINNCPECANAIALDYAGRIEIFLEE